ncbi:hypothetical protein EC957_007624 [Mortierella hygrophila]|uniref:Uncharacterized protein n=1 Tax=Mortierella hygrophila TaxID=979708 RepID=A0A9P6K5Z3_9FUNG|nr:hypothetical protein EC957_007624 [Mortierella hygrophila]
MFAAKATKADSPVVPKERNLERPVPKNSSQTLSRDKSSLSTTSYDSQEFSRTPNHDNSDYSGFEGGEDIDDESIYSKNDRTLVAYFGPLPREAEEALNNSDPYTNTMISKVDFDTGFAMVVSHTKCYIWAVQKETTYRSPPMCYTLPMPPNNNPTLETAPLLPVVTITKSDEPHYGILACSPDGTCWYWNNIDICFSNVDQHVDAKINIQPKDYVSKVECAGPMGYFVATKFANVYQVSIKKQYGANTLALTQLNGKPGSTITSIFSMIGVAQGPDESQHLAAMTSGPRLQDQHGRWDLFVMTRKSLLQWHLYRSGECTLETEFPLRDEIKDRILEDHTAVLPMGSDPSVRVLDIQYIRNGKLLVFTTFFNTAHREAQTPLACALFTISCRNGSGFDIERVRYLKRTIEEDIRPEASPKLVVPLGGPGVFIVMPRAVIISSTLPDSAFEDLIPLKTDRIIGSGHEDWKQHVQDLATSSELTIICKSSGRLGIHLQLDDKGHPLPLIATSTENEKEEMSAQLQAKLEQAVFFSGKKHNPISFDLAHYDGGDLNQASLNVSREILNSHAQLLGTGSDVTTGLSVRYQRIKNIIDCIQDAEMASRLLVDTRFQLCWSAEKLAAANEVWSQYQQRRRDVRDDKTLKENLDRVLQDAAAENLRRIGARSTEDPVANFMKYHVNELGALLSSLQTSVAKTQESHRAILVRDINKILIASLRSAWNFRRLNVGKYALQDRSTLEPWTGTENIIDTLTKQYSATSNLCAVAPGQNGTSMDVDKVSSESLTPLEHELRDQLYDLADLTLQARSEHLHYLEGLPTSTESNIRIASAVTAYDDAKTALLGPLADLDKAQRVIQLAQKYKDFATLVQLTSDDEEVINGYIAKYQQEFANALFQWYIDTDQMTKLLEQSEQNGDLFTDFIDNHDCCDFGWLHDIKIKRFGEGSRRLQEAAARENYLDRRMTMASLSKLLFLAEGTRDGVVHEGTASYAARCNDELNTATVQVDVANFFETQGEAMATVPDKAEAVLKVLGSPILAKQKVLRKGVLEAITILLERNVLSSEDFLDVLMLQQATDINGTDVCGLALDICFQATDIPENRRPYVLQDIWRRIFIADKDAYWRLENVSELEARERLMASWVCRAYAVIFHADGHKDEMMLRPQEAKCTMPDNLFRERSLARGETDEAELRRRYEGLIQDYERENDELDQRIREGQLLEKWERVKMIVKEERAAAMMALGSQDAMMEDAEMA